MQKKCKLKISCSDLHAIKTHFQLRKHHLRGSKKKMLQLPSPSYNSLKLLFITILFVCISLIVLLYCSILTHYDHT